MNINIRTHIGHVKNIESNVYKKKKLLKNKYITSIRLCIITALFGSANSLFFIPSLFNSVFVSCVSCMCDCTWFCLELQSIPHFSSFSLVAFYRLEFIHLKAYNAHPGTTHTHSHPTVPTRPNDMYRRRFVMTNPTEQTQWNLINSTRSTYTQNVSYISFRPQYFFFFFHFLFCRKAYGTKFNHLPGCSLLFGRLDMTYDAGPGQDSEICDGKIPKVHTKRVKRNVSHCNGGTMPHILTQFHWFDSIFCMFCRRAKISCCALWRNS